MVQYFRPNNKFKVTNHDIKEHINPDFLKAVNSLYTAGYELDDKILARAVTQNYGYMLIKTLNEFKSEVADSWGFKYFQNEAVDSSGERLTSASVGLTTKKRATASKEIDPANTMFTLVNTVTNSDASITSKFEINRDIPVRKFDNAFIQYIPGRRATGYGVVAGFKVPYLFPVSSLNRGRSRAGGNTGYFIRLRTSPNRPLLVPLEDVEEFGVEKRLAHPFYGVNPYSSLSDSNVYLYGKANVRFAGEKAIDLFTERFEHLDYAKQFEQDIQESLEYLIVRHFKNK